MAQDVRHLALGDMPVRERVKWAQGTDAHGNLVSLEGLFLMVERPPDSLINQAAVNAVVPEVTFMTRIKSADFNKIATLWGGGVYSVGKGGATNEGLLQVR